MGASDLIIRIATQGAKLAQAQMSALGSTAKKSSARLAQFAKVGAGVVAGALLAIGKGASESVRAFTDFDDALTQSLAIMQTNTAQQERMAQVARDVAMETTISATESAEAFFFLASAGLDAEQSIAALPQVAKFAQAGMFDMALATDLATDAQSALGLSVDDAQKNLQNLTRVTDVLVKANTLANATVQQFSEALTNKAGAALKVVNKDIEEGVAVLAAFADRGVKGAEAGEKLNQILRDVPRATAKNRKEFEALGLEMFDTEGNMKNVADIISELDSVLGVMSDEMKAATLDQLGLNRGVADAVKILSGAEDEIRAYESALRDAGGTTEQIAQKQLESFKSQLDLLNNAVNNFAIIMGQDLIPALSKAVGFFQTATERLIKFKERQDDAEGSSKAFKLAIIGVVSAIAPFFPVVTAVGLGLATLVRIIGKGNEEFRKNQDISVRTIDVYRRMRNQYHETTEEAGEMVEVHKSLDEILDGTNFTVDELTKQFEENNIVLDENAKEALKTAQAYEDGLLGGLQSVVDALDQMEAMQNRITKAEERRNKALKKQMEAEKAVENASNDLEKAKEKLQDVQGKGAEVTADEELAILRAKNAIDELTDAQDGSREMELQLAIAKQEYNRLVEESTALSRDEEKAMRDIEQAEKALVRAKEEQTRAIDNVREAQKELNKVSEQSFKNTLNQAIAQEQLTKALSKFGEGTKGYEDALKKMSRITGVEIDKLMKMYDDLFLKSSRIGLSPSPSSESETTSSSTDGSPSGGNKFPASGGGAVPMEFTPVSSSGLLTRAGNTNFITVNPQAILGTPQEVEEAVAKALQEASRRGINVAF
jgi:TP901 family phage tail tape measure protein